MRHLGTTLKAVGAVAVLGLVGNSVSLAATGQGLILGKANKADRATTIQRTTNGPVLNIRNRNAAAAPFTVNGRGRVVNLNADRLDGLDSRQFARTSDTAALTRRIDATETATTAADSRATTAANAAATADSKATAADARAAGTASDVAAITPRLPIAQAVVDTDLSTFGHGIVSVTRASTGWYDIALTEAPSYFYADYVTQITPVSGSCHVSASSGGNKLLVTTRNNADTPTNNCPFYVTVTPH